ncbi:uncharacterized protein LOC141785346 isoform X2 [Halichoeres trimaculatus]|uniref:uncharacterized protein LOC141785346 isoform X2 n=1 Tax=Halichoeres trimaculatus TaxID=147232 RepID=UPI003D9F1C43
MQCANILKRRRLEPGDTWREKRVCLEAELLSADCPMETSLSFTLSNQQQQQQQQQMQENAVQPRPVLCCPRCLGGEPGHINHIMGH